jgi:hypothetical protein
MTAPGIDPASPPASGRMDITGRVRAVLQDCRPDRLPRPPDTSEELYLGKQKVRIKAWHQLHFKRLAGLV